MRKRASSRAVSRISDWGYVAAAAAHGALWIAALLVLACAIFRKRDFV